MFIKLGVILLVVQVSTASFKNYDWDLAVTKYTEIEFLKSNGSLVRATTNQFSKLKALTFDNFRQQFVVTNQDQLNDTILAVQLNKETENITAILEDLPDDIMGLAVDPITDTLYWTDTRTKAINFVPLNDTTFESATLISFNDETPEGIVIDVCNRYIYWINTEKPPTINRAKLDGTEQETIIDKDLTVPSGLAIDYHNHKLFWTDMGDGIDYWIQSSNLDGKERQTVYTGNYGKPLGIAVDSLAVYWTDVSQNSLWKKMKYDDRSEPVKIRQYDTPPLGLIVKDVQITDISQCVNEAETTKQINRESEVVPSFHTSEETSSKCLNNGEMIGNTCKCPYGFSGKLCEENICYNYCVNGDCYLSPEGYPQCRCQGGFEGGRCEKRMCDGYCLNGGTCSHGSKNDDLPKCECTKDYVGSRCEVSTSFRSLCELYCRNMMSGVLVSENEDISCRCERGLYILSPLNATNQLLMAEESFDHRLQDDPLFLAVTSMLLLSFSVVVVLSVYICLIRKRRPRIKKRFIVNKNVTPLTYRPQPTEQCEITIENCCNMNVCETPCFEPPQFRAFQKNEDKKKLLANLDGEDLY